jgi:hypothetical protein
MIGLNDFKYVLFVLPNVGAVEAEGNSVLRDLELRGVINEAFDADRGVVVVTGVCCAFNSSSSFTLTKPAVVGASPGVVF